MKRISSLVLLAAAFAAHSVPAAEVLRVGNVSHVVGSLERSLEFYRDVIGLEPGTAPTEWSPNPAIMRLGDTPGAQSRIATLRVPGSQLGLELIEYKDIERRPVQIRFQDPGASNLMLRVRDLDAIVERVRGSSGRVWTPSGEPITLGGTARAIFVQDPDGFFVELLEGMPAQAGAGGGAAAPATPAAEPPPAGNILGGDFELIVADSEATAEFYREALGYEVAAGADFDDDELLTNTANTLGAAFRRSTSTIPGTRVSMIFMEFKDINRAPLTTRTQDPGTTILQLFVDDVPAMLRALVAAGGTPVSTGGEPADLGGGMLAAIVRDPNNLFIELLPARR
jgi:predicted enzyme related to lactoylglutathione lyase